jgi:hypothetical protein
LCAHKSPQKQCPAPGVGSTSCVKSEPSSRSHGRLFLAASC